MLFPAAILVVLILGSIAVDFSIVFLAERELAAAAAAAANDAAGAGVDTEHFRDTGEVVLDPDAVDRVGRAAMARRASSFDLTDGTITVVDDDTVEVVVRAEARYIFAKIIPGAPRTATVEARARADAVVR
jgi:Flp pilus assembly protein TadG